MYSLSQPVLPFVDFDECYGAPTNNKFRTHDSRLGTEYSPISDGKFTNL